MSREDVEMRMKIRRVAEGLHGGDDGDDGEPSVRQLEPADQTR